MKSFALVGPMQCGKDTVAEYFVNKLTHKRIALADELKIEACHMLNCSGDGKEYDIDYINKKKEEFRPFLQWWGEHRRSEDPYYWINKIKYKMSWYPNTSFVITDARYTNELNYLSNNNFIIIRIEAERGLLDSNYEKSGMTPETIQKALSHVSERQWKTFQPDLTVRNGYGMLDSVIKTISEWVGCNSSSTLID